MASRDVGMCDAVGAASTLCGRCSSWVFSIRGVWYYERTLVSFLIDSQCFTFSRAPLGTIALNRSSNSVAAITVRSPSEIVGILHHAGYRVYVPVIMTPPVSFLKNFRSP